MSVQAQTLTGTATATPPPQAWDNPQATVQSFIQDMTAKNLDEAAKSLDLSDIPFPVRDTRGERYAGVLASVLARIHDLHVDKISTNPNSPPVSIPVNLKNGKEAGAVGLSKGSDGYWRFDSKTITELPHLYRAVENEPQDNGLGPFPDITPSNGFYIREIMPSFLLHSFLWFELWQWIGLALMFGASVLLAWIVRAVIRLLLKTVFKHLANHLTDFTMWSLRKSLGLIAGGGLWWATYDYLGLEGGAFVVLVFLLKAFMCGAIAWVADALFDLVMDSVSARASTVVKRADAILIPIAKKFVRFVFVLFALLAFAGSMSVNVTGLVTGLGIGGLVLALAGKDSVENIFGSLTIIFDMPFGIGDYIKMTGAEGTVEEINLRSTRIRTPQDTLITQPNSNLIKAAVENFGARRARRFVVSLPVSYANELSRVTAFCERARKEIKKIDQVRQEDAYIEISSADENAIGLNVQLFFMTDSYAEELELRTRTMEALLKAAKDAKVMLGIVQWNPPPSQNPPDPAAQSSKPQTN